MGIKDNEELAYKRPEAVFLGQNGVSFASSAGLVKNRPAGTKIF